MPNVRRISLVGLSLACAALVGCPAEDEPPADEGGEEGTTGDDETTAEESGTTPPMTTSETDPMPMTTTGDGPDGIPAGGGIRIDYIEANQGIGVKIGENGEWVGADGRTAPIIQNRVTLVRVFWRVPNDWEPREIEGRVTFYLPDGETVEQSEVKMIMDDSFAGSLDETFNFGLQAEEALPGTGYSVELYEVDESFADPSVTEPPRLPENEESVLVGLEDSYQKLKVVIVPFNYDDGGSCVTSPDLTDETMQLYADKLFQMNPIDAQEIEIHESIDWDTELTDLSEINNFLSTLRFDEGAPPETYYFGHIDACSGGVGSASGLAHGIPSDPTMENAYQRVSTGLSYDPELSAETFVHEVGHTQGRRHVACSGEEGGANPMFPQEGGDIGEWGFGVIDFRLRHPTATKDYMTYCTPTWVSNFGWNRVYPTIQELSSWELEDGGGGGDGTRLTEPYGDGSLLVGTLIPGGKELWSTVPGGVKEEELTDDIQVEFTIGGQVLTTQDTRVTNSPDSDVRIVVTPLPEAFDAVDTMTRIEAGQRVPVIQDNVTRRHHYRTVRR